MINVIDQNIKMNKKYILISYSRTVFNNLSDNKINIRKLKVNPQKLISTELRLKCNLIYIKYKKSPKNA